MQAQIIILHLIRQWILSGCKFDGGIWGQVGRGDRDGILNFLREHQILLTINLIAYSKEGFI